MASLDFFLGFGQNISMNLIQIERLLDIMKAKPTVVNKDNIEEFILIGGVVDFDYIHFSYNDKKLILENIHFFVLSGTTAAFVRTTNTGKSTILRLLYRLYDMTTSFIKIDGQDIYKIDLPKYIFHFYRSFIYLLFVRILS